MSQSSQERRAERRAAAGFLLGVVGSIGLLVVYWRGGQPQLEGIFLAVAFGGMGAAFVVWGNRLLPQGPVEEEREPLPTTTEERGDFREDFERGGVIKRRKLLTRMLGLAALALGGAAFFPIRSLGPGPGNTLKKTSWKRGAKLVDEEGREVKVDTVPIGGMLTVFPEGHTGSESADSQAVLVRLEEGLLKARPGRKDWAPEGLAVFSKICTHAGCPVGLYQADTHQLLCPCHQSAFDVLEEARPVFGPATRALPQLPIEIGPDDVLVARGDFSAPSGPNSWNIP